MVLFALFGYPSWLVVAIMGRCAARMNIGWPGADGLLDVCVVVVVVSELQASLACGETNRHPHHRTLAHDNALILFQTQTTKTR